MEIQRLTLGLTVAALAAACSGTTSQEPDGAYQTVPNNYQVVASGQTGASGAAAPGDIVNLTLTGSNLPSTANIYWSCANDPNNIAVSATAPGPGLPAFGAVPTAVFLQYPAGAPTGIGPNTLFVLDEGTGGPSVVSVSAFVVADQANAGKPLPWKAGGFATGNVQTGDPLMGDPVAGATTYATNCASCHTATGGADDAGISLVALTSSWTQGVFTVSTLAGIDNTAAQLPAAHPAFYGTLTTQNVADVYAYLVSLAAPATSTTTGGSAGTTAAASTGGSTGTTGAAASGTSSSSGASGTTTAASSSGAATTTAATGSGTGSSGAATTTSSGTTG